jgi:hypothetical protein
MPNEEPLLLCSGLVSEGSGTELARVTDMAEGPGR